MPKRDIAPVGAPCWIDLYTSDMNRSREFYGELLGWTSEQAGEEYGGYVNFSSDGVMVAGAMTNDGASGSPDVWSVYLAVEDARRTADAAVEHGGQLYIEPMEIGELGVMTLLADPGGAAIGIWQPGLHKGFGVMAEPNAPAWFELFTRDHAKAVAFYRDVFGWDTYVVGDTDEFRYTTFGENEGALAGVMDASGFLPEAVPDHWSVYFQVDDVDAALAKAASMGGSIVVPAEDTPYGRLAQASDPTGASFKLLTP